MKRLEWAERKAIWMARATAHFDTPQIRKEASDKFNKANMNKDFYIEHLTDCKQCEQTQDDEFLSADARDMLIQAHVEDAFDDLIARNEI